MIFKKGIRSSRHVLAALLWLLLWCISSEAVEPFNKTVATVNGVPILKKELMWAVSSLEHRQIASEVREPGNLKKDALDGLIHRELLFQESRKQGITVQASEIDEEYQKLLDSLPRDIDMDTSAKELGLAESDIKNEFLRMISIRKLLEQALDVDDSATEKELRLFYTEHPERFMIPGRVHVGHILIKADEAFTEPQRRSAKKRIETIKGRLSAGEDFAVLAREYSEESSGKSGGDIGFFRRGELEKSFEDAAFALQQGQISGIVETRYGYHIVKAFEKKPETVADFERVKPKLEQYVKDEKNNRAQDAFVQKLKEKAVIKVFTDIEK